MPWQEHVSATRTAQAVFSPVHYAPRVLSNGRGKSLLDPTPYGAVILVGVQGNGFLVAARRPPQIQVNPSDLPPKLRQDLEQRGFVPWKLVAGDCATVIRSLVPASPDQQAAESAAEPSDSPHLVPMRTSPLLDGENRQRCCHMAAAILDSQQYPGPLAYVRGIDGAGKRTLAATVADRKQWRLRGEMPLGRLFAERMLQTPVEGALDAILTLAPACGPADLVAVSDAELLMTVDKRARAILLRELARLPHVVLLARPAADVPDDVAVIACPGLEHTQDARKVIAGEHPEIEFAGGALAMLVRAASVRGVGIVPGRLLYLVRLARACLTGVRPGDLAETDGAADPGGGLAEPLILAPDEVSAAIEVAHQVWSER